MRCVLGVDEAGRGPLAGPVAVGAVLVEEGYDILAVFPGLNDSKKLSEKKREALYELLLKEAKKGNVRAKVCFGSEKTIDRQGITTAIRSALFRAIRSLSEEPEDVYVYLDGSLKAPKEYRQEMVIGGDGTVPVIMLASIVAKVTRDRLMLQLAKEYPAYGFEKHKGYGTKAHFAAIEAYGLCAIHRRSFL